MRAIVCEAHGPPEALVLRGDVPVPEPGPGELRIRVRAAGVNFPDSLVIQNLYQVQPPLPFSPGSEAAGTVDAVGAGVTGFAVGDRVAAMTIHGAFAEAVTVPAGRVVPVPDGMDFETAAGFTMAYGTSYHALKQRAGLAPGETVLVLGAAGGVGLAAVELARAMGARVIAAASSDAKLALARSRGADDAINYAEADLRAAVRDLTGGRGVDVVYDPVGAGLAETAFRTLAWQGRYLVVGFAGGTIPSLPLNLPLLKGSSLVGVFWGAFVKNEPMRHRENVAELYRWYAEGRLKPHVSRRFSLEEAPQAIRWIMDRKADGKVVVTL